MLVKVVELVGVLLLRSPERSATTGMSAAISEQYTHARHEVQADGPHRLQDRLRHLEEGSHLVVHQCLQKLIAAMFQVRVRKG